MSRRAITTICPTLTQYFASAVRANLYGPDRGSLLIPV
jgi:hypothetical protein